MSSVCSGWTCWQAGDYLLTLLLTLWTAPGSAPLLLGSASPPAGEAGRSRVGKSLTSKPPCSWARLPPSWAEAPPHAISWGRVVAAVGLTGLYRTSLCWLLASLIMSTAAAPLSSCSIPATATYHVTGQGPTARPVAKATVTDKSPGARAQWRLGFVDPRTSRKQIWWVTEEHQHLLKKNTKRLLSGTKCTSLEVPLT